MKSIVKVVAIAAILAAPIASFAQSNQQPMTRAEVRNQLIQIEHAGYNPGTAGNDPAYPSDVQAAERRVEAQNPAVAQTQEPVADTSGYGAAMSGSSQSGGMMQPTDSPKSVYFGH